MSSFLIWVWMWRKCWPVESKEINHMLMNWNGFGGVRKCLVKKGSYAAVDKIVRVSVLNEKGWRRETRNFAILYEWKRIGESIGRGGILDLWILRKPYKIPGREQYGLRFLYWSSEMILSFLNWLRKSYIWFSLWIVSRIGSLSSFLNVVSSSKLSSVFLLKSDRPRSTKPFPLSGLTMMMLVSSLNLFKTISSSFVKMMEGGE